MNVKLTTLTSGTKAGVYFCMLKFTHLFEFLLKLSLSHIFDYQFNIDKNISKQMFTVLLFQCLKKAPNRSCYNIYITQIYELKNRFVFTCRRLAAEFATAQRRRTISNFTSIIHRSFIVRSYYKAPEEKMRESQLICAGDLIILPLCFSYVNKYMNSKLFTWLCIKSTRHSFFPYQKN